LDEHDNHSNRHLIPDEKFIDIIKTRLLKDDCHNGVVIEGVDSKYASNAAVILKGIMKACPNRNKRVFLNLITDLPNIHLREAQMKQKNNKTDSIEVKMISEEEYDKLSPEEQKKYDEMLKNYKKQKKLMKDQIKIEKKKQTEVEQQKIEKKTDDEKIKRKERNKSFLIPKNTSKDSSDKCGKEIKDIAPDKSVLQSFVKSFTILKSLIEGRRSVSPQLTKKKDEKEKDKEKEREREREKENGKENNKEKDKEKNEKEKLEKALEHEILSNIDISNSTLKKCETYTSTMDLILGVLKEGEKYNHNSVNSGNYSNNSNTSYGNGKQNQNLNINEKRNTQQRNKIDIVGLQSTESSNDNESKDEYLFGYYFEINSNVTKDEAFAAIINNIPSSLDPEKLKNEMLAKELVPKIEQVICYPEDTLEIKEEKYSFSLVNILQDEIILKPLYRKYLLPHQ
jgi:hypothetical protein